MSADPITEATERRQRVLSQLKLRQVTASGCVEVYGYTGKLVHNSTARAAGKSESEQPSPPSAGTEAKE